jgi:hypothetical protein
MKRTTTLLLLALSAACGGGNEATKGPEVPTGDTVPPTGDGADAGVATTDNGGPSAEADAGPKASPCSGFEMDLGTALMASSCEVENPKSDVKPFETKGKLDIKVSVSMGAVAPGGHVDLTVLMTNKTAQPIALDFTLDPTPRFVIEAYDSTGKKRVDLPPGNPPALPKGMAPREATIHNTSRITIVPNGTAKMLVGWDAVRTKWAPEKLKGTPPEMGYPRAPAGPLPKGKYMLRVVTPLVGVFEGLDKEVSAPKVEISVQ